LYDFIGEFIEGPIKLMLLFFFLQGYKMNMSKNQDWETVILSKSIPVTHTPKVQKEKEDAPLATVSIDLKIAMQQARMAAKLGQKELAAKMCVPTQVIHSYENGTAIPNNAFIAKIEKVLNTKLPRIKKAKPVTN
jgi:ribosome-binding protein aMBF1 (putative translation factor)